MLTLAIDTTGPGGGVAVCRDGRILGAVSTTSDEAYSSRFFRQLEYLLGELSVGLAQVDLFVVVNGPGSFTGLRVGITTAKALGEAHGKPVIGVGALEALAAEVGGEGRYVAPVLDGRRGQIFGALYEEAGGDVREVMAQGVFEAEAFIEKVREQLHETVHEQVRERAGNVPVVFITPAPELIESRISSLQGSMIFTATGMLAPAAARLGERRAAAGRATSALELDANYIRRCDAELLWKAS